MINETPPKNAEKPISNTGMKQEIVHSKIFQFVLIKRSGNFAPLF